MAKLIQKKKKELSDTVSVLCRLNTSLKDRWLTAFNVIAVEFGREKKQKFCPHRNTKRSCTGESSVKSRYRPWLSNVFGFSY